MAVDHHPFSTVVTVDGAKDVQGEPPDAHPGISGKLLDQLRHQR
jgi:hypothetical protein